MVLRHVHLFCLSERVRLAARLLAGQWWRSTMRETSRRQCTGLYAAAMAGHISLDPLTLHIDCEGTIATVNGPKCKALGAGSPRGHVWNRLLVSHDEVRAVKAKGHATQRDVEAGRTSHLCKRGNDFADTFAKKGADTHKPAFRVAKTVVACGAVGSAGLRFAQVHGLERHQGCRSETTGKATASKAQAHEAGERQAGFRSGVRLAFSHRSHTLLARQSSGPSHIQRAQLAVGTSFRFCGSGAGECHHLLRQMWSGVQGTGGCAVPQLHRTSQLRKLRSGLFPNKRYPGWTVEHVRRPTLDEATTLVAQLESCEAGPTTHKM